MQIYLNRINKKTTFIIKTIYYLELLTSETTKASKIRKQKIKMLKNTACRDY